MVNLDSHHFHTLRFIHSCYLSNEGMNTFVQLLFVSNHQDPDGTYHGVFPDTKVGISMTEYLYQKTCSSSEKAKSLKPTWLHWRQQEALELKRNTFDI